MNPRHDALYSARSPKIGEHPEHDKKTTFDGTNPPVVEDPSHYTTYGMVLALNLQAGTDLKNSSTAFTYCGSLGAVR